MKFYFIHPIELYSPSRRWITDDVGLQVVQNMYTHYPKGFNKWPEFDHRVVSEFSVDFGGIMSMDEPIIHLKVEDTTLNMQVTHLPLLIDALTDARAAKNEPGFGEVWSFSMFPKIGTAWHKSTRDVVLAKANELLSNCEEMIEGCNRDFDEKIKQVNHDKMVVLSNPRSKPRQ